MSRINGSKIIHPPCTIRLNGGYLPESIYAEKYWQEHVITKAGNTPDEDVIMIRQVRVNHHLVNNEPKYFLEVMNLRWFVRGKSTESFGVPLPRKWEPYVDLPSAYD